MRNRFFTIALSILALTACGGKTDTTDSADSGTQTTESSSSKPSVLMKNITIAQFGHLFLYLPVYVAERKGYYKDEGLNVRLVSTGGDEKTFAAVSSGNAQFGVADPTFVAIARSRGQGGMIVAQVVNGVPFWGVAFKDSIKPIEKMEDLKGLKLATFSAPSTSYTVMKKILQNNGKPIDATIVQGAPTGSIVAMVQANQADIAMELEPTASIAVSNGAHVVISLQKKFGDFAITGLSCSEEFLKEHPKDVVAVTRALDRAMKYIHSDYEGTLAVAKQEFPEIDEKVLRSALTRMIDEGTIPKSPIMTKEGWDKAIELRRQVGDIKSGGEFEKNVDMSYAQQALEPAAK